MLPNLGSKAKMRNVPGKRSIRRKVEVDKIKNNAIVKKIGFNRVILIGVLILMYLLFGGLCAALGRASFFTMNRIYSALN